MGRTATLNKDEIIAHVLSECAAGRPISKILKEDDGMPCASTFWGWQLHDDDLMAKVTQARAHGVEAKLDEGMEIVDDLQEDAQSRKVRFQARVQMAQMLKPKTYGPRLDLTSGGEKLGLPAEIEASRRRAAEGE